MRCKDHGIRPANSQRSRWTWLVVLIACAPPTDAAECEDEWGAHPEWIFCHDFEAPDSSDFDTYWNDVYGVPDRTFLIDDNPAGIAGSHALRTQAVNDTDTALDSGVSSGPKKFLGREVDWDAVYYRKYVRFNREFKQGNFMHMGGLSACAPRDYPWACMGHAGERPTGDDRFSSNLEPWSDYQRLPFPGRWGFYSYYHQMYMDCGHPGPDDCWGDMFSPDEDFFLDRGDWHVLEMMIQPNTPGVADGYQVFWVDGVRIYTSPEINWRTDESLRINKVGVYLYIHHVPAHTACILDFDNVVISQAYVGPSRCQDGVAISAPCLCAGEPNPDDASNVHASGFCCEGIWQATACAEPVDGGSSDDGDPSDDGGDAGTTEPDGGADPDDADASGTDESKAADSVSGSCGCGNPGFPGAHPLLWVAFWLGFSRTRPRRSSGEG